MKTNDTFLKLAVYAASLLLGTPLTGLAQRTELDRTTLSRDQTLLEDRPAERGFKSLFNGKDLSGWDGAPKIWSVKDGAITGQTTPENPAKGNTFLIWTNGEVSDFELRCSFKMTPNNTNGFANSGIQYRSKVLDPSYWVVGGYQADMEAGPTYTGILYEERMSRGIMAARGEKVVWNKDCAKQVTGSFGTSAELQAVIKQGDWNDYVVIAQGNHLQHFINGRQMVDVTDECTSKAAPSGVLALQMHAGPPFTVQFKNIRIKTLSGTRASADEDIKMLQGKWRAASAEANGDPVPGEDITNVVVTVKGTSYSVINAEVTDHGSFTVDPAQQPKQMDIHAEGGDASGEMLPAIYEVGPDTLRVCYARRGASRPAEFATAADARLLLIVYKRLTE